MNDIKSLAVSTIAEIEYKGKIILTYLDKYDPKEFKTEIEQYIEERQKWGITNE